MDGVRGYAFGHQDIKYKYNNNEFTQLLIFLTCLVNIAWVYTSHALICNVMNDVQHENKNTDPNWQGFVDTTFCIELLPCDVIISNHSIIF